jgi:oligopeptide transport system substrate-binding protein
VPRFKENIARLQAPLLTIPMILGPRKLNMIRAIRAALALCVLTALCGCGRSGSLPTNVETLRRGLSGEPSTLDPAAAADNFSSEVLRDLYEGLTAESPTGAVIPAVASSWTVDSTGLEYTFKLRSDARWSNGQPVRAREFVNAWRRVVDPKLGSPVADDFRFIVGATAIIEGKSPVTDLAVYAPSDDVLIVRLENPVPYFPQLLTHAAAYPIYSEASARSHDPKFSISNGPYSLESWSPSTAVHLIANPNYWDHSNVRLPRVEYVLTKDENVQYAAFRAGQVDLTDTVPASILPALLHNHDPDLFIAPFLATAYYGFNLSRSPFAGNLKLRQALTMAIDRRKLVGALSAGQTEAFAFVSPGVSNYERQSWPWKNLGDQERLEEARRLYAEAGYSSKKRLHLNLLFNSNAGIKNTAIIIASMWKEVLDIDTTLTDEEYRVFLQSRHDKSRWDVVRLGWVADYNDASNFLDAFRQHSTNNDEGYSNSEFDSLLDQAAKTYDLTERRALLEKGESVMLADYPITPLYFFVSKRLVKPYVHGLEANPLNHILTKWLEVDPH